MAQRRGVTLNSLPFFTAIPPSAYLGLSCFYSAYFYAAWLADRMARPYSSWKTMNYFNALILAVALWMPAGLSAAGHDFQTVEQAIVAL